MTDDRPAPADHAHGPRTARLARRPTLTPLLAGLLAALLAAAVTLPGLGRAGLTASEGHRAIPGWTMLDRGDPWRIELFDRPYLRKPPGMPWAIAASSALVGRTPLAARLPSAVGAMLMAALTGVFAARWFGPRAGLWAGCVQALLPLHWQFARLGEIETLHNAATMAAGLCLADALLRPPARALTEPARVRAELLLGALAGLALAGMLLLKGPAGLPAIAGVLAAACLLRRSLAPLRARASLVMCAVALVIVAPLAGLVLAAHDDPATVRQSPGAFAWNRDHLAGVALFVPAALASALPVSIMLFFAFGPDARREAALDPAPARARADALALGLARATLLALALGVLAGLSNPRYAQPMLTLAAPLAGYLFAGAAGPLRFLPHRARLARLTMLGHPAALPAALALAAAIIIPRLEASKHKHDGRELGAELARAVLDHAGAPGAAHTPRITLRANLALDARPDVLWYACRAAAGDIAHAAAAGDAHTLVPRWVDADALTTPTPAGDGPTFVLTLEGTDDDARLRTHQAAGDAEALWRGTLHVYVFRLYRLRPTTDPPRAPTAAPMPNPPLTPAPTPTP